MSGPDSVNHSVIPCAERFSRRLPPPRSFSEATASIQAALDELRAAEAALDTQLADLRAYIRVGADARLCA
ncbi:MAG: hypothetical protein JWN93_1509 [Hyphomicrobiales bacterium]|nr:hypothetical protein [Hyphomicrobiales bacterium]